MKVETICADHDKYLSDVYGIDYVNGDPYEGWSDPSALFCDNVVFWCLIHWIMGTTPKGDIGTYISLIRGLFAEFLETVQFKVSVVTSGRYKEENDVFSSLMQKKKAKELDRKDISPGYISIKVSFENVLFVDLLPILKFVVKKLADSFVIMHDMDIAVDLARISTRAIIASYLSSIGVVKARIVNDRHSVGDNCISWYGSTTIKDTTTKLRAKLYNKFIQMVESSEIRSKLGSKLSYLVANTDLDLAEKLQRYKKAGMTRLEITLYGSKVYKAKYYQGLMDEYLDLLSECPTYRVSYRKQWKQIVKRLTQMLVVYIPETSTFTYCHWWNSLTGRFQGLQKSGIAPSEVKVLMSNLSYNDRPVHYLECEVHDKQYSVINYVKYRRVEGSVEITMVPGPGNSLYPFRGQLKQKALMFADVGMAKYMNITLEWPDSRVSRKNRQRALADLEEWHAENSTASPCGTSLLQVLDTVVMSKYKPDYKVMDEGETYMVTGYGYGVYRGKEYLCLTLNVSSSVVYARCTCLGVQQLLPTYIDQGKVFSIEVQRHKIVKSKHDMECKALV
jgi:hypothetical protein